MFSMRIGLTTVFVVFNFQFKTQIPKESSRLQLEAQTVEELLIDSLMDLITRWI